MDLSRYDAPTQELVNHYLDLQRRQEPAAWKALAKLQKLAKQSGDDALLGFVCYQYAYSNYYSGGNPKKIRSHLTEAVRHFLRCEDYEQLARTYNFIAVDAHSSGVFDIAYNYYLTSLFYNAQKESPGNRALVEINLGRLFSQLGNYELARRHMRNSIRHMKADKNVLLHDRNLIVLYLNDAFISLRLEDEESAKRSFQKTSALLEKADPSEVSDTLLSFLFLQVEIALIEKKPGTSRKLLRQTVDLLRETTRLYEFSDDIFDLCDALLRAKRYKAIEEIIDAVNNTVMEQGTPRLKLRFAEYKVRFYSLRKDEKHLKEALLEQYRLYQEQKREQATLLEYYTDLVSMIGTLHEEQENVHREHLVLQLEARTDSLTGMPNRHAMIRQLERAFEKAYHQKKMLGVEILDIDAFKQYNDTYGHQAGDACLSRLSWSLMRLSAHPNIFCARYGGDEFVIIYEDMTDEEVLAHANRLKQEVEAQRIPHSGSTVSRYITISQGICNGVPKSKNRLWDFLSEADLALYSIKKGDLPASRGNAVRLNPQPAQGQGKQSLRFSAPAFSSVLSSESSSVSSAGQKKKASAKRSPKHRGQ